MNDIIRRKTRELANKLLAKYGNRIDVMESGKYNYFVGSIMRQYAAIDKKESDDAAAKGAVFVVNPIVIARRFGMIEEQLSLHYEKKPIVGAPIMAAKAAVPAAVPLPYVDRDVARLAATDSALRAEKEKTNKMRASAEFNKRLTAMEINALDYGNIEILARRLASKLVPFLGKTIDTMSIWKERYLRVYINCILDKYLAILNDRTILYPGTSDHAGRFSIRMKKIEGMLDNDASREEIKKIKLD